MSKTLTDTCPMPFGKHEGEPMENVPDSYLLWLWNENKHAYLNDISMRHSMEIVMEYIQDSFDEKRL